MHAITPDARSTRHANYNAADNAREFSGIEKFIFKQIKNFTPLRNPNGE
jgi:hypothetical protein